LSKYKFTVKLNDGREAHCYFGADTFYDALVRTGNMVKDLENRKCVVLTSRLEQQLKIKVC
jgi:hypothetical protein